MATSSNTPDHHSVIKYCVERGMTPGQTIKEMEMSKSHCKASRVLIYKWHKRYSSGWTDSEMKTGRPTQISDIFIQRVSDVIKADRRQTVREVSSIVGMSKSSVQSILSGELGMSRVCARWVPRLLEQMQRRVTDSRSFIRQQGRDINFLDKVITMDETWAHYYEPEGKKQSSIWKTPGTPPALKAKSVKSMGKVMFMVFMDNKGIILTHAVCPGQTVNANYYSKVVRIDLIRAIRKKRPAMVDDLENIIYHHDNAPPHTAASIDLEIALLGFRRLSHPPYSPDLAPLDFAYFPLLKENLRGRRFTDTDELTQAVLSFNRTLPRQWFADTFLRWTKRHRKCIQHQGQYFEKL